MAEQENFVPKKPSYRLKIRSKSGSQYSATIGAAWEGKNGNLHIHLNPLVVLRERDDFQITLFPVGKKEQCDENL